MPDALPPIRKKTSLDVEALGDPVRASFVELGVTTNFSFLRGASTSLDLAETARMLGYEALGIADANTMAGVVRLHSDGKDVRLKPVIGCRIETVEGLAFLAYPRDRAAYGRLCRLISAGRMATLEGKWQAKGACDITLAMLAGHAEGVQLILMPPENLETVFTIAAESTVIPFPPAEEQLFQSFTVPFPDILRQLVHQLPTLGHLAATYLYRGDDVARIERLDALARVHGLKLLATNDVHYHVPECRPLQDVMTAIRHKTTVAKAGYLLHANAERHLKSAAEMEKLFEHWPHAITAAREVADACTFTLDELRYEYPKSIYPEGRTAQQHLEYLTWEGAAGHYPSGTPDHVQDAIKKEFGLIADKQIATYFLTIKEIVDFARSRNILCQGRGSAANSAVCFCLGITSVNPAEHQLLFDRFISEDRSEPPDIDVDFEHERREEVIQHIYETYGREKAGLCATVIHYRPRMAIREVGKAMGLSEDVTSALGRTVWGSHGKDIDQIHAAKTGLNLSDPHLRRVLKLTGQMIGMPRHLSQHVGGFILTDNDLIDTVPIGNAAMPDRTFIEWDKDDIDELGIFKVDVLALGMLTCIRKCLDLLKAHHGRELSLTTVPREDKETYEMLCRGDSLGVFQVESRAQMNMLPRLRPREYYDLVVQVAIVRPGPIQGDMVHPYLKRRRGAEEVTLPGPSPEHGPPDELSLILKRTYGVPIFQEQAMKIALDAAKFKPHEANQLRKAMATFRSRGNVGDLEELMVEKMVERGYDRDFAMRCFNQIKGFGEYGFPESHAASFARLVYVSSWLKCHFPAAFACALLNSQPMGFYSSAQIVRDAREHEVDVLPVDVNHSDWNNTLAEHNGGVGLRLGLRQIDGFPESAAEKLEKARAAGGLFHDVQALRDRADLMPAHIEKLAAADCFGSLGLSRRQALWDARSLVGAPVLSLFDHAKTRDEGAERSRAILPVMPFSEEVITDYQTHRLSLKAHPMAFLRASLAERGFLRTRELREQSYRAIIQIAGVVLIRQRPGSAKGVCFVTLEDETGVANIVVWPDLMERQRPIVMGARLMEVRGRVEYDDEVIHVIATHLVDATSALDSLSEDEPATRTAIPQLGHPRNNRIIPKSRDFH